MFKRMQIDVVAATFKLLRLLLVVTLWSCHAFVAPIFRLCHGLVDLTFGSLGSQVDGNRVTATLWQVGASGYRANGVLTDSAARSPDLKPEPRTHYSKLLELRSGVARIASIPRIWGHGAKATRIQQKIMKNEPSNPRTLEPSNPSGFTLIELILVMALIGILAAVVLSKIDFGAASSRASVDGAAYMVASDIRYAQEFAMANRVSKSIQFSTAPPANKYTFNPVSTGMDPSGQLSGATIGTTVTFTFNSLGEPTVGGGSFVTLTDGVRSRTITVLQYTGKVNIS
jgi:prepilin-type N-terminal cleavage/methylation domain-containing protein